MYYSKLVVSHCREKPDVGHVVPKEQKRHCKTDGLSKIYESGRLLRKLSMPSEYDECPNVLYISVRIQPRESTDDMIIIGESINEVMSRMF